MAWRANPTSYAGTSTSAVRLRNASGPALPSNADWCIGIWHRLDNITGAFTEFMVDVGAGATNAASTLQFFWKNSTFATNPSHYQFVCVGSEGTASSQTFDSTSTFAADSTDRLLVIQYTTLTKTFSLRTCAKGASVSAQGSVQKLDFLGIASGKVWALGRREVDSLRGSRNSAAEFFFVNSALTDAQIEDIAVGVPVDDASVSPTIAPVIYLPLLTAAQTQTNDGSGGSSYDFTAANGSDIGATTTHPFAGATPPTSWDLTGPTSGSAGAVSTALTITLDQPAQSTITFTMASTDAGDTFRDAADANTITTVQITSGNSTAQFRLLCDASTGARTVSATDDGGLTDDSGISYTATTDPVVTISNPADGGNINLASTTVTANGTSPIITLVPHVEACTDISATARWWGFKFAYEADQDTTPIVNVRVTSPAEWHLSLLGDSLTAWRPPYSTDGGQTWSRVSAQSAGTHSDSGDTDYRTFQLPTIASGTEVLIAYDIPRGLTAPGGVEDTLTDWLTGADAAKFQPSPTAVALSNPSYTPTYGDGVLQAYIAWMSTASTAVGSRSIPALPAYGLTLDDSGQGPEAGNAKVDVVIICGGHPSEGVGRKTLTAFIDRVLQADTEGNGLRKYCRFRLLPNINPAGEYALYYRSTPEQVTRDFNRQWDSTNSTVTNRARTAMVTDVDGNTVAAFFDMHGEGNTTPTLYGRQDNTGYVRYKAKLQTLRGTTDFALDADDGKRSWNWAIAAPSPDPDDGLGAWLAVISERETIGSPNEPDRQAWAEEQSIALYQTLAENRLLAVPHGSFVVGEAVEVRFRTPGSAFTSGLTIAAADLTPAGTNGTFGAVAYNAGGKYFSAEFTPTAPGAVTITTTNDQDWIDVQFSATATEGATITSVSVAPSSATIYLTDSRTFTATVSGTEDFDTAVDWTIESGGGTLVNVTDSSVGYVAGITVGSATLRATSVQDPTKYGEASITISEAPPAPSVPNGGGLAVRRNKGRAMTYAEREALRRKEAEFTFSAPIADGFEGRISEVNAELDRFMEKLTRGK